jgi:hypothetical protein
MRSLIALVLLSGCAFSPPIRGLHVGMPDRVARGELELGVTAGGFSTAGRPSAPLIGAAHVAYGLRETMVLEAGANVSLFEGAQWATTWAGVRMIRSKALGSSLRLVGDAEFGAGVGLGGIDFSPPPKSGVTPAPWTSRHVGGFYGGLAVGLRWHWLGAFLRARLDASASTAAPSTLWPTVLMGLEARAGKYLVFALAGGAFTFWNDGRVEPLVPGFFYQAQVSLLFDLLHHQR